MSKEQKDFEALSARVKKEVVGDRLEEPDTRLKTREKMLVALELRKHGYTYSKIAEAIGCTHAYAQKIINRALKEVTREASEELVELELHRLDNIFLKPFERAVQIGGEKDVKSCLAIMERRSRLLGLDGAIKFEDLTAYDSPRAKLLGMLGVTLADDEAAVQAEEE